MSLNCMHQQVYCSSCRWCMSTEPWWNDTDRGKPKNSKKNLLLYPPQIPHGLTWARVSYVVRGQWLTAWAMAWPKMLMLVFLVVTPCRLVGRYQHFGDTYCLHLQDLEAVCSSKCSTQSCNPQNQHKQRPEISVKIMKKAVPSPESWQQAACVCPDPTTYSTVLLIFTKLKNHNTGHLTSFIIWNIFDTNTSVMSTCNMGTPPAAFYIGVLNFVRWHDL
jgi:hypothetical protein